jgi:hypothetical protein
MNGLNNVGGIEENSTKALGLRHTTVTTLLLTSVVEDLRSNRFVRDHNSRPFEGDWAGRMHKDIEGVEGGCYVFKGWHAGNYIHIRLHNGIAHSDTHSIGQLACPAD